MKHPILLPMLLGLLAGSAFAQPGFSEGREYRYPTRFDVAPPGQINRNQNANPFLPDNTQVVQVPSVVPSDFQTRRTGVGVSATEINITGRVVVVNSHDGSELVTLRSSSGTEFRVATGSTFSMNRQAFRAEGFRNGIYQVRSLANQQVYYFVPNQ
jgi:hypothetical protein